MASKKFPCWYFLFPIAFIILLHSSYKIRMISPYWEIITFIISNVYKACQFTIHILLYVLWHGCTSFILLLLVSILTNPLMKWVVTIVVVHKNVGHGQWWITTMIGLRKWLIRNKCCTIMTTIKEPLVWS